MGGGGGGGGGGEGARYGFLLYTYVRYIISYILENEQICIFNT